MNFPQQRLPYRADGRTTAPAQPVCPHCGSAAATLAGTRPLKSGELRQLFLCAGCGRRYSHSNRSGKHTPPEVMLRALERICARVSYSEIIADLQREFGVKVAKATLSRWVRDFPLPWLEIRDAVLKAGEPTVRAHLFTHAQLNYDFQIHLPKLRLAGERFRALSHYLTSLPLFLDHSLFERAVHCSSAHLAANPGLRHCRNTGLNRLAAAALQLAPNNRQRHSTLERYFLHGDRNTVATEVPVYYFEKAIGDLVAGHIDLLQIWPDKVRILDYKPAAAKENFARVVTQLSLYAHALRQRAHLDDIPIECVFFDEHDAFFFEPVAITAQPVTNQLDISANHSSDAKSGDSQKLGSFEIFPADRQKS